MSTWERWPMLNRCLEQGSLSFIDLAFANSILKKVDPDNAKEEHAALLAALFALSRQGHLMLDISNEALHVALHLLAVEDVGSFAEVLQRGAASFPLQAMTGPCAWICRFGSYYYLQKNWVHESKIIESLARLSKSSLRIALSIQQTNPCLNEAQATAVSKGLSNSLSFLTGGPGTGKTFTAAELVKACLSSLPLDKKSQFRIILTAPTGKAVAQLERNLTRALEEKIDVRAGTLHAILGIKAHVQEEEELIPLFADLIIVDECSMIDVRIFSRLLMSVPSGARLILIGDKDQLPPVEAGSIFADLLGASIYPATYLTECLRSDCSEILNFARSIKEGNVDAALQCLSEKNTINITWTDLKEGHYASSLQCAKLWDDCHDRFPSYFTENPLAGSLLNEIGAFGLLSCMRQGPLGVDAVNRYFLNQYLEQAPQNVWWVAPVMITRNDYELELYNGDLGFLVRKVTPDFSLKQLHLCDYVLFRDRKGGYRQIAALALSAFEYSYCLSVHKSQGSEYDEAWILMPRGSELFGREVLYTAITRARSKVAIAASMDLLRQTITNSSRKISGLSARLKMTPSNLSTEP